MEAINVHFLGGGSDHVITLSSPNESGEYLFHSFTFITFTSFLLNIGDNAQPKCKGRVNDDTLGNAIALDVCLFNSRCVIKLKEILDRAILAPN